MKPVFTIHEGEYLVGSYIENKFKKINLWVPSKDTGVAVVTKSVDNRPSGFSNYATSFITSPLL